MIVDALDPFGGQALASGQGDNSVLHTPGLLFGIHLGLFRFDDGLIRCDDHMAGGLEQMFIGVIFYLIRLQGVVLPLDHHVTCGDDHSLGIARNLVGRDVDGLGEGGAADKQQAGSD